MLDFKRVFAAKPKPHKNVRLNSLQTPWGQSLDPLNVLQEHPNPQFKRASFTILNGMWNYAIVPMGKQPSYSSKALTNCILEAPRPDVFDGDILVPFSPEAPLSGVNRQLQPNQLLWYSRTLTTPTPEEGTRSILHFEAVDYVCACWCNGTLLGTHVGGYLPFSFDMTDALHEGENELLVCVADPSEHGIQLRGKQRLDRGDIWYTAQSGIWQTVWYETVPETHLVGINTNANTSNGVVRIVLDTTPVPAGTVARAAILDAEGNKLVEGKVEMKEQTTRAVVALSVPKHQAWSPDHPYLYTVQATVGEDSATSYFAFRSVEVKRDGKGVSRVFLNGQPIFLKGVLDQGYWPDGLMTAPSDEALAYDIEQARALGFNMMRKHIKMESRRWYYHADRLGMLVWQDMISGGSAHNSWQISYKPTLFQRSWQAFDDRTPEHQAALSAGDDAYQLEWTETCRSMVMLLKNHPSIITWVLFNEGWGQFDARAATALVRQIDPMRPIDSVSGWYDQGCGDFLSEHNYFRPLESKSNQAGDRAYAISEFGGLAWSVPDHVALDSEYGYAAYASIDAWQKAVANVLKTADKLERKGLAGYVYTQLTDVEEETNGLLTYDRMKKN